MARALQSRLVVLARAGVLAPAFASIEEYLGQNTDAYYSVLAEVGSETCLAARSATLDRGSDSL